MLPDPTMARLNAICISLVALKKTLELEELAESHLDWLETDVRGLEVVLLDLEGIFYK